MAMADPLSAAPPTIARNTMPMKICDMPSAFPVPSAAPTRISLIQAASTDAPTRLATARGTLHASPSWCVASAAASDARERAGMRLEREHQVQHVREQQHAGDAEVEHLLLPHRALRCEVAAERARHGEAHGGEQHHRAVHARGDRVVLLVA